MVTTLSLCDTAACNGWGSSGSGFALSRDNNTDVMQDSQQS